MLAHLYPRITKKLLRNENKYNKYRYLESVLYQERERDRAPLVELSSSIKRLASMDPRDREAVNLRRRLRLDANKNLAPIKIRVAPYVQIAAITRYLLFAKNIPEHEAKLAGYIGSDFAFQIAVIGTLDLLPDEHKMPRLSAIADYIDARLQDADAQLPDLEKAV